MLLITRGNAGKKKKGDYLFFRDSNGKLQKDGLYTQILDGVFYSINEVDGMIDNLSSIRYNINLMPHSVIQNKELNSKAQIDIHSLTDNDIQLIYNSFGRVKE